MAMIGKVRRLHYRQQKSVREIARITSLSRNTVRKWLKAPVAGEPKYRRGTRPGKLTAFHEALQQALKADGHRPKRNRLRNRIDHDHATRRNTITSNPTTLIHCRSFQ